LKAEFYRDGSPDGVVGTATWDGHGVRCAADEEEVRRSVEWIVRPVPVVIEDPSLRSYGTSGPVQLAPGSLQWFMAAAESRAREVGLRVRFTAGAQAGPAWDPAGTYRPFTQQIERRALPQAEPA
jgi:hypothetical protein